MTESGSCPAPAVFVAVDHASVSYGRRRVLDNVSISVSPGERLAVIGPSGAGKTTLFRLIAGLIKPDDGRVITLGRDTSKISGKRLRQLRREVGFLHQQDNLIPQLRVVHNVLMGRLGYWWLPQALWSLLWPQQLDLATAALGQVELEDRLWSLPDELSGGQQQRVAVARLIVQQPKLILADEPVSALDIRLGQEIIGLLCELAKRDRATLLINLHTLDLLQGNFDRVVALHAGRVFWQGSPAEISQQLLRELYGAEYRALHLDDLALPT